MSAYSQPTKSYVRSITRTRSSMSKARFLIWVLTANIQKSDHPSAQHAIASIVQLAPYQ